LRFNNERLVWHVHLAGLLCPAAAAKCLKWGPKISICAFQESSVLGFVWTRVQTLGCGADCRGVATPRPYWSVPGHSSLNHLYKSEGHHPYESQGLKRDHSSKQDRSLRLGFSLRRSKANEREVIMRMRAKATECTRAALSRPRMMEKCNVAEHARSKM